eukprot:CAMPEP_0171229934 /NCGR_PEP_ID=MMETSP0790-20130122/39138_1 /TAXON_ID=2925 /ORGANISM="Alexandrium catenella, Strain OF101" /LENGTH=43 /DNA_ID= /DNA_START= /DNA_END= /DNA_ORIENTATION=
MTSPVALADGAAQPRGTAPALNGPAGKRPSPPAKRSDMHAAPA